MTDPILTRLDAINAMAKGEKCETHVKGEWRETYWADFDCRTQFRRPPEPRREAREWWIATYRNTGRFAGCAISAPTDDDRAVGQHLEYARVREVLPDEAVVRRMTEAEARTAILMSRAHAGPLCSVEEVVIVFAKYLGLIVESGS